MAADDSAASLALARALVAMLALRESTSGCVCVCVCVCMSMDVCVCMSMYVSVICRLGLTLHAHIRTQLTHSIPETHLGPLLQCTGELLRLVRPEPSQQPDCVFVHESLCLFMCVCVHVWACARVCV